MKIGTLAVIGSMLLSPVSSVFAADKTPELVAFTDGSQDDFSNMEVDTKNLYPITNNDQNIEPAGVLTTAYVVTASSLYVRSGRGTGYSILGSVSKGQTIYVYNNSLSDGWVKIKFSGAAGYVNAQYIKKK